jgi:3-(3-hydroxy-phenyl)propionate hydroxylase
MGRFDDILGNGWQLISVGGDPAELCHADDLAWFRQIGGVVADLSSRGQIEDVNGAYRRWFAEHECQALLARPDFYVFGAGAHLDTPRFLTRLRTALEPVPTAGD